MLGITPDGIFWAAREFKRRFPGDVELLIVTTHDPRAARARECPETLSDQDVSESLVRFLNKWSCRLPYEIAPPVREVLVSTAQARRGWERSAVEAGLEGAVLEGVERVFDVLRKAQCFTRRARSLGPTPAAKTLGVIYPALCVMWDERIRESYGCGSTGAGYVAFLYKMSVLARQLVTQWERRSLRTALFEAACGAAKYDVSQPLAVLIDHYNWLTITGGLEPSSGP